MTRWLVDYIYTAGAQTQTTARHSVANHTFEGENFREFHGFVAIREFSPRNLEAWHKRAILKFSPRKSKVFSLESFPSYILLFPKLRSRVTLGFEAQGRRTDHEPRNQPHLFPK